MTGRILAADTVFTGSGGRAQADGAVLVRGELIADVGRLADVIARAAPGTPVTHYPGSTILPGFVDSHVHLAFGAEDDPVAAMNALDDEALYKAMAARALALLDAGVTTVRDLGDRGGLAVRLRDEIAAGLRPGPRILAAGAPITVPGGHCWFFGGEARGARGVREVARRNLDGGADLLKIMATGGNLTRGGPATWEAQFTAAEIAVAVEEAHRAGRRVAAHAHGADGIEAALAGGVDTLEHCTFVAAGPRGTAPEVRVDLVRATAEQGVYVCPTYSAAFERLVRAKGEEAARPWLDVVALEYEHGVRLIAGTDAGTPGAEFGRYAEGLEWFGRAGLPHHAVLKLATGVAADALGLGSRIGRIAPGRAADLVIVDGEPLADLRVLRRPRLVVVRGSDHLPNIAEEKAP